jgi:phenylacetate-CoA ligase
MAMLNSICLVRRTPLDAWIAKRIGHPASEDPLDPTALKQWQMESCTALLDRLRLKSLFYRKRLPAFLKNADDTDFWSALPFTTAHDLRTHGPELLCVSQGEVARAATLPTSGTTGQPKRILFTAADLERTVDFFHHGMGTFTNPGQRVLVLMPGPRPASIGDLLRRALQRIDCEAIVHGLAPDPGAALLAVHKKKADVLVGVPIQVLAMARHSRADLGRRLQAVLLSADHVSLALRHVVEEAFACPVFVHWGMTETGYGGAVECSARQGCHLRSADLLVEIINPRSGQVLPDGQEGEVVLTTLTSEAMPLLRYRTGDLARLSRKPCPCGSRLPRLNGIRGRLHDQIPVGQKKKVSMPVLDEILLPLPWLWNYQPAMRREGRSWFLDLDLFAPSLSRSDPADRVMARDQVKTALSRAGLFRDSRLELGAVSLSLSFDHAAGFWKRRLKRPEMEQSA